MWNFTQWSLSLLGHLALWSCLFNVLHATAFSRPGKKLSEKAILLAVFGPVCWVLYQWFAMQSVDFDAIRTASSIAYFYGWGCILIGVFFALRWGWRKMLFRPACQLLSESSEVVQVSELVGHNLYQGRLSELLGKLPFNQSTELQIDRRKLAVRRFPKSLNGLKIAQLSDLHFTGQIQPEFFDEVVRRANEFQPDLLLLTGDVVDEPECLPWIDRVLGKLEARYGKFYVLGNHDLRIRDEERLRELMAKAGWGALRDQWEAVQMEGETIWLAGNEIPWFPGAEALPDRPVVSDDLFDAECRILLSHSPDQWEWAQARGFDAMFAGHTHGGQIRFPVIGPVIAPSRYGIKYCSGTFDMDGMVMHVSRGLSGDDPIRVNCRPELGLFELVAERI